MATSKNTTSATDIDESKATTDNSKFISDSAFTKSHLTLAKSLRKEGWYIYDRDGGNGTGASGSHTGHKNFRHTTRRVQSAHFKPAVRSLSLNGDSRRLSSCSEQQRNIHEQTSGTRSVISRPIRPTKPQSGSKIPVRTLNNRLPSGEKICTTGDTPPVPLNHDEKRSSTSSNCTLPCNEEGEEENDHISNKGCFPETNKPESEACTITVRYRPTNDTYQVCIHPDLTVGELISEVCQKANTNKQDHCYLYFSSRELDNYDTVCKAGLYAVSESAVNLPEVRLNYLQQLQTSAHIGKHVILVSPEKIAHEKLLNIHLPSNKDNLLPLVLKQIAEQIARRTTSVFRSCYMSNTVLIPLPYFPKGVIDHLPTIQIKLPLMPTEFDWNMFLEVLANDLEIQAIDMIIVNAQKGSTFWKIKLKSISFILSQGKQKLEKILDKLSLLVLPKSKKFINEHKSSDTSEVEQILVELHNFATKKNNKDDHSILSTDDVDFTLGLCARPAIIDELGWEFLTEKSRQIKIGLLHGFQECSEEYVLDHVSLIYNEELSEKYQSLKHIGNDERILYHGTRMENFNGIFEENFHLDSKAKKTDDGWYGKGIYFSSSPLYALEYAKNHLGHKLEIRYLICCVVRLGKQKVITNMDFYGKEMDSDFDSHYVQVAKDGTLITVDKIPIFEEFVIKRSKQIMPLHIIGIRQVFSFLIWRDAKITDAVNSAIFEEMKQRYNVNIYGIQTTTEALKILRCKLANKKLNCVVVTNGADSGENFARECRKIRLNVEIAVYCMRVDHHQRWATVIEGPEIKVADNSQEIFNFINKKLKIQLSAC